LKKLIIPIFISLILCLIPASSHPQVFSLWADESMTTCGIYADQYETYTVYVFLDPGTDGAFAAEYQLMLPDSHVSIQDDPNSFISGATIGNPTGPPGIAAPFISCQSSTVWLYRHTVFVWGDRSREWVTLGPNDDSQFCGIAICPDPRPIVDCAMYNYLGVNQGCCGASAPWLISAEASNIDQVLATFDEGFEMVTSSFFEDHFILYAADVPADTIEIVGGEWLDGQTVRCLLNLERDMDEMRTYTLVAYDICDSHGHFCLTMEQSFDTPHIATQLQQFSAELSPELIKLNWQLSSIDPGTVFQISRCESDEPFDAVGEIAGTEGELSYTFEDRSITGGKTYIYRVEYVSDTDRGILFETDVIETAPVPVTLAQNHPNPFNPSTTIEFYIPEAGQVSLRVFDVSGRLVRTLVDDSMEPGSHSVTWNGQDENGNSVPSGVYFSRFRTGKTTLSKKMILLR